MTNPFDVTNAQDLATPALVAIVAILLFIAILAFQSKKRKPHRHEVEELGNHGEQFIESTVFVQEGQHVVRRSTRPRKPVGGETPVKAAAPAADETATPKTRQSSRSTKTPVKAATPAKETTPVAVEERELASPPRTRSRRTPRA